MKSVKYLAVLVIVIMTLWATACDELSQIPEYISPPEPQEQETHVEVSTGPYIDSVYPASGAPGTTMTIRGENFNDIPVIRWVAFGDTHADKILSWTDNEIVAKIPALSCVPVRAGTVDVTVQGPGLRSNGKPFIYREPRVESIFPSFAKPGKEVIIKGTDFGIKEASNCYWVKFGASQAHVEANAWSDTEIILNAPADYGTGIGDAQMVQRLLSLVIAGWTGSQPFEESIDILLDLLSIDLASIQFSESDPWWVTLKNIMVAIGVPGVQVSPEGNMKVAVIVRTPAGISEPELFTYSLPEIAVKEEAVSQPNNPTGPSSCEVRQSSSYSTGGASSNLGHNLEYRFDWGDGSYSSWSSLATASHSWSSDGTYTIRVQARCATHTSIVSGWSSGLVVNVAFSILPTHVLSPVVGELEVVNANSACSDTKWCFNQHKTPGVPGHSLGGGIGQADDTYAWDANLNQPNHDSDAGKEVYAVATGVVANTYGSRVNAGGSYGQILLEHDYQGSKWWSGYLHLSNIQVSHGQTVTENTILGYISNTSPDSIPNHLHSVFYTGSNTLGGLISFNTEIVERPGQSPDPEVECLARVIMSEASVGTREEQVSVAWTVLNRLRSGTYGATICEVVKSPSQYAYNQDPTPSILQLATELIANPGTDPTGGATHFFSPISMPKEGDITTGYDIGGGLHEVLGISKKVYFPSFTKTLEWVRDIYNVRSAYFMFYRQPTQSLSPPTALSPGTGSEPGQVISGLTPTLSWSVSQGADFYSVAISIYPYGTSNIIYSASNIQGTSHPIPGSYLTAGYKYRWNMRAWDSSGSSDYSNTLYFQTAVTNVTLTLYVHENSASGPFISGATVTGQDGADNSFSQATNSNGYVTITGVPGTWSFTASKSGYAPNSWSQSITVTDTKHAHLIEEETQPSPPTLVDVGIASEGDPWPPQTFLQARPGDKIIAWYTFSYSGLNMLVNLKTAIVDTNGNEIGNQVSGPGLWIINPFENPIRGVGVEYKLSDDAVPGTYDVKCSIWSEDDTRQYDSVLKSGWLMVVLEEESETISTSDMPMGPSTGEVNQSLTYSAGGASSSLGHGLQYRFDWGDGSYSSWSSSTSASHSWPSEGTYIVKAQARCANHTSAVSDWSSGLLVNIEPLPLVSARIDSYSPSSLVDVTVGDSTKISITFTNTGNTAWSFIAGATVWDSNGNQVANYSKTLSASLQPQQQTTVSWTHTVNHPGNYWLQFGVWKATPFTTENLLDKEPSPSQKLIVGHDPAKFHIGDRVQTTTNLNVRTGPGTGRPEITDPDYSGYAPVDSTGVVLSGPVSADGYVWWEIQYDAGYTGWSAEDWLTKA